MAGAWYRKNALRATLLTQLGLSVGFSPIGHAEEKPHPSHKDQDPTTVKSSLIHGEGKIVLSVHWEGRDILDHNLTTLAEIRTQFPDIPMIHFISPAYFLRSPTEALAARQKIRTVMRSQDQVGLALGGWKSLIKKAGAIFRNGPTFWGYAMRPSDCEIDCGQDIPVHIYPESELDKVVETASKTLEEHGFGRPRGLAVTGWMASPQVLEAASRVGITHDFSSVSTLPLSHALRPYPLHYWVKSLWTKASPTFRSYPIPTQTSSIIEVPQSLPGIDYVTVPEVLEIYEAFIASQKNDHTEDLIGPGERVFQIVLYQETAAMLAPRVGKLLSGILSERNQAKKNLISLTIPGMAVPLDEGVNALTH